LSHRHPWQITCLSHISHLSKLVFHFGKKYRVEHVKLREN
jgi:hypothetical protein